MLRIFFCWQRSKSSCSDRFGSIGQSAGSVYCLSLSEKNFFMTSVSLECRSQWCRRFRTAISWPSFSPQSICRFELFCLSRTLPLFSQCGDGTLEVSKTSQPRVNWSLLLKHVATVVPSVYTPTCASRPLEPYRRCLDYDVITFPRTFEIRAYWRSEISKNNSSPPLYASPRSSNATVSRYL